MKVPKEKENSDSGGLASWLPLERINSYMGNPLNLAVEPQEKEAPITFTYSLTYVYYD